MTRHDTVSGTVTQRASVPVVEQLSQKAPAFTYTFLFPVPGVVLDDLMLHELTRVFPRSGCTHRTPWGGVDESVPNLSVLSFSCARSIRRRRLKIHVHGLVH